MQRIYIWNGLPGVLVAVALSGCATVTPDMRWPAQSNAHETLTEQHLINHIQCQLAKAVQDALRFDETNSQVPANLRAKWLEDWGAKISLVMTVNNKNNISPGLTFTHPLENAVTVFAHNGNVMTGQNRSVGLGFTWSADATRTETIGFFYPFKDLKSAIDADKCKLSEGSYLSSDLKISEFLVKGIDISYQPGVLIRKEGDTPYSTFTYEVKFVVTTGGNVTPAWKLVELSANQSSNLFAASRIHTDDLTITMGKVMTDQKTQVLVPSDELNQQHLANLIGQSVANSLQGRAQQ